MILFVYKYVVEIVTTSVPFKLSLFNILHKPRQSIIVTTFNAISYTFTIINLFI